MKYFTIYIPAIWMLLTISTSIVIAGDKTLDFRTDKVNQELIQLDPVVVKGKSESEDKQYIESRVLKSHTVLDLAEILADELVEVQMIRKGGYGNEVSMRGFGQENMKVFLDGGMLEGACGSRKDPSLSHVNMLSVQDLVIKQGPFDVTKPGYLGGYVEVVTKKPQSGFSGEVLGKMGGFDYYSSGFFTRGGNNKVQGLLGYNYSESDQYKDGDGHRLWKVRQGLPASYNSDGRDEKAFQKNDLWAKLQLRPNEKQTLLLEHTYGKNEDIITPRVVFDTEKEISNMSKASWQISDIGKLSERLTLSFFRNEIEHDPFQKFRSVDLPKEGELESVITGGSIQNITKTKLARFKFGLDMYHRDWSGDIYNSLTGSKLNDYLIPSVDTFNIGGYAQINKEYEKWGLELGLRYDYFQQEADEDLVHTSRVTDENRQIDHLLGGYLSANYFLTRNIMAFASIGRNYRTPTSAERYIQGSPTYFGNPEIEPTANTELDAGLRFEEKGWTVQLKGFYSDLKDYIYQENNPSGYKSYTNIDAHIFGGDIKSSLDLISDFSLEGGLAYQRGLKDSYPDNNHDRDLGQIPPLKGRLALKYKSNEPFGIKKNQLFGTLEWIHSNAATDIDQEAGEQRLSSWDVINIRLGFWLNSLKFNFGVDNIFDRQYTVANSYEWDVIGGKGANPAIVNEPGRFVYASLGYTW